MTSKKIGIFGGTFDPFTFAHMAIVEKVLDDGLVDCVKIIPTIVSYHRADKAPWLSDTQRIAVINAFIQNSRHKDKLSIETIEYDFKAHHSKYVCNERRFIHTLMDLKYRYSYNINDEYYVILGTDSLWNFTTWYKHNDILFNAKIIGVSGRNDILMPDNIPIKHSIAIPVKYAAVSASKIREKYENSRYGFNDYIEYIYDEYAKLNPR